MTDATDHLQQLQEDVYRTARLTGPTFLCRGNGSVIGDTITTSKGHRNVLGITHETDAENDAVIEDLMDFIDERAYGELIGDHPDLADDARSALLTDPLAPVRSFDLSAHAYGAYTFDDLSFNLMPRRSTLLPHFYEALATTSGDDDYDKYDDIDTKTTLGRIAIVLDATCTRGAGCYYATTFFPDVDVPAGPVAFGSGIEYLVVDTIGQLSGRHALYELLGSLNEALVTVDAGGGASRRGADDAHLCICCLLVQQAGNRLDARSGGHWDVDAPANEPLLIVRNDGVDTHFAPRQTSRHVRMGAGTGTTSDMSSAGLFVRSKTPDYFSSVISTHSSAYTLQLADELDFGAYRILYDSATDDWRVTKKSVIVDNGESATGGSARSIV